MKKNNLEAAVIETKGRLDFTADEIEKSENMKDMYIVVKLSDAKKLAEILREEVFEKEGPYSYVLTDLQFRLRKDVPLLKRIDNESGADILDIVNKLKRLNLCPACLNEGQQHSCSSLHAQKLGRRLKRLLDRAENTI